MRETLQNYYAKFDMKIPFVDLHAQYLSIKGEIDDAIDEVIRESALVRENMLLRLRKIMHKNKVPSTVLPVQMELMHYILG